MDNDTPSTCRADVRDTTTPPAAARSPTATRRRFLGSALLAAPLAVPASMALAHAMPAADAGNTRLLQFRTSRLEDAGALHDLHRDWLRQVNAGAPALLPARLPGDPSDGQVRRITPHPEGVADRLDFQPDGLRAAGYYDCLVETESALPAGLAPLQALVDMARAQGHGATRRTERRKLVLDYARDAEDRGSDAAAGEHWRIERAAWVD